MSNAQKSHGNTHTGSSPQALIQVGTPRCGVQMALLNVRHRIPNPRQWPSASTQNQKSSSTENFSFKPSQGVPRRSKPFQAFFRKKRLFIFGAGQSSKTNQLSPASTLNALSKRESIPLNRLLFSPPRKPMQTYATPFNTPPPPFFKIRCSMLRCVLKSVWVRVHPWLKNIQKPRDSNRFQAAANQKANPCFGLIQVEKHQEDMLERRSLKKYSRMRYLSCVLCLFWITIFQEKKNNNCNAKCGTNGYRCRIMTSMRSPTGARDQRQKIHCLAFTPLVRSSRATVLVALTEPETPPASPVQVPVILAWLALSASQVVAVVVSASASPPPASSSKTQTIGWRRVSSPRQYAASFAVYSRNTTTLSLP
jgi:hypothetical protein